MKILDLINILLAVGIIAQLYAPTPSLISLQKQDSPPRSLHQPQAAQQALHHQLLAIGPMVNVEDLIRYLEQDPAVASSATIHQHLVTMQQTQQSLFATEEAILTAEEQLNKIALELYQSLTPEQQRALNNNRNLDSVQRIEKGYWDRLIEQSNE